MTMDRVCVVDLSGPTYADPTAHECVAVVAVAVGDSPELSALADSVGAMVYTVSWLAVTVAVCGVFILRKRG
jgi:hypothetical protein